jgi:glycosyltransferase involved in cell wall biosynthesis
MRWFVKFVWPKLFLSFPALRLRVLGKEAELVASLFTSLERVDIVGPIAHAVEEIAKSQVAIAPLLFGSGTRLKILEAWAAGTPVVSTPLGAEGLGAVAGQHLEIAETPELFARRIEDLLRNELRRHELARTARILLETRFTWTQAHNLLADLEL